MEREFEQDLDAAIDFRASLTPETDRGCAMMAAAYLDSRLAEWLTSCFVDDSKAAGALLGQNGPLSTFSSRIDITYLIGLISLRERKALHSIRKIRNQFGHVPEPISFNDHRIANWCKSLEDLSFYRRSSHRAMFTGAVMAVLAAINVRRRATPRFEVKEEPNLGKADREEPIELFGALIDLLNSPPNEKEHAKRRFQAVCSAALKASPGLGDEIGKKIVDHVAGRVGDLSDSEKKTS